MEISDEDQPPHHYVRRGRRTNLLASCLIASVVIVVAAGALAVVSFTLFRPRDPKISIRSVRLPAFSSGNGTASFTFQQEAAVRNPNRDALSHYDSSVQVLCAGRQVAFMFIPAGEIGGRTTQHMAATMAVGSIAVGDEKGVVVETKMHLKGRVRLLRFLTHRVETTARCQVAVSAVDGSVVGFQCL